MIGQFRFRDFLRSVEGSIWRVVRATTPPLVSPNPSASNAFKPAWLTRLEPLRPQPGMEPGDHRIDVVDRQADRRLQRRRIGRHVGAFEHDGADVGMRAPPAPLPASTTSCAASATSRSSFSALISTRKNSRPFSVPAIGVSSGTPAPARWAGVSVARSPSRCRRACRAAGSPAPTAPASATRSRPARRPRRRSRAGTATGSRSWW